MTGNAGSIWIYDEYGNVIGEYTYPRGAPVQELVRVGSVPAVVAGNFSTTCQTPPSINYGLGYVWTDNLDTPRSITSANGSLIWQWDSAPFGDTSPNDNPSGLGVVNFNHRYAGQYVDSVTGLYHNGFRTYDPQLGRYIQSDPTGFDGGINGYAYASSNPLKYSDPSGLVTVCLYPGGLGFGHVGVGLDNSSTEGFYPASLPLGPDPIARGSVQRDKKPPVDCKNIPTTQEQDDEILRAIAERKNNPGFYALVGSNCVDFAREVLGRGGIPTSYSIAPRQFFDTLPTPPRP